MQVKQVLEIFISLLTAQYPPTDTTPEPAAAVREPLTSERLFSFLLPHASKWQSLGEALSLDEDRLDEIYTNNQTDEACLQEMIEVYMLRSDLDHSWEEIQAILENIESSSEFDVCFEHVRLYYAQPVVVNITSCNAIIDSSVGGKIH